MNYKIRVYLQTCVDTEVEAKDEYEAKMKVRESDYWQGETEQILTNLDVNGLYQPSILDENGDEIY